LRKAESIGQGSSLRSPARRARKARLGKTTEDRNQPPSPDGFGAPRRSEIRRQEIAVRRKGFSCGSGFSVLPVPGAVPGSLPALSLSKGRGQPRSFALNYFYDFYDFYGFYDFNDLPLTRPIVHEMV